MKAVTKDAARCADIRHFVHDSDNGLETVLTYRPAPLVRLVAFPVVQLFPMTASGSWHDLEQFPSLTLLRRRSVAVPSVVMKTGILLAGEDDQVCGGALQHSRAHSGVKRLRQNFSDFLTSVF